MTGKRIVQHGLGIGPLRAEPGRPQHGYWKIPPEIYDPLNEEFHFDFDPCPNPRPEGFDGLKVEWGESNWVNPPFWSGTAYWAKKTLAEVAKGKDAVVILPLDRWAWYLTRPVSATGPGHTVETYRNADGTREIRVIGPHPWIHTATGERQKLGARPSFLFVLRGRKVT
jgi:hypothetical protein